MFDFISIGNISIDLYFKGKTLTRVDNRFNLAIGGKYYADYFYEDVGGGGANVAAGLSKFGYKVAMLGRIGDNPFKEMVLLKLNEKKIATDFCRFEKNYYKISSVILSEEGERTIINYESPDFKNDEFYFNEKLKEIKNFYFSPLPNLSISKKLELMKFIKDHSTIFFNPSKKDCQQKEKELDELFKLSSIIILNAYEYSQIIRKPYENIDFRGSQLELSTLRDKVTIITDAERGSYGYFKGKIFFQEAIRPKKIIDTTGCGDGYTAGFIAEYLKSKDIKESMEQGAKYASVILSKIGAN